MEPMERFIASTATHSSLDIDKSLTIKDGWMSKLSQEKKTIN
jgi:hypothetical protein